jgi:HEAT repeat protein
LCGAASGESSDMALSVTPETRALLKDFLERRRAWGQSPESPEQLLIDLDAIHRRGESDAAILLWQGFEKGPAAVQHRTLEVITALLTSAGASRVLSLVDEASWGEDALWSQANRERWRRIEPEAVRSAASDRPASAGLLVLLSGHQDGYVREAAVIGLDGLTMPFVLTALRHRLNDWVEPVRQAAVRVLRGFLSPEHAASLVGSLDLLEGLRRCGRADHQAVLDQIDMVLREPASQPQVQAGLSSPNPAIRRGCYAALLHGRDADAWLAWGLEAVDPWIRLHAARAIQALPPERLPAGCIDRIAACGLRPVRQIAVEMIGKAGDVDRLRGFLLDRSPTIREFARFYLSKCLGQFDAQAYYRDGLLDVADSRLDRYIAGLGETGDANAVPAIMPYARHRRTMVRLAAFRALDRVALDNQTEVFLEALADPSGRIRQAAFAALAARRHEVSIDRLASWAGTADPNGRRCAVLLIGNYPRDVQPQSLLPFLNDSDDTVRGLAERLCIRCLSLLFDPSRVHDPWRAWVEQHCFAWSAEHRERVRELLRARARKISRHN